MNVRRLAAIDMYGLYGTTRRRRIVLTEFVLGVVVLVVVGIVIAVDAPRVGGRVFGGWLAGVGLNYAPLTVHAITLIRPGRLEDELSDVDPRTELRQYALQQFWIFVPMLLIIWDLTQRRSAPQRP